MGGVGEQGVKGVGQVRCAVDQRRAGLLVPGVPHAAPPRREHAAAFPESHFDRLEALQPVWVPYYVVRSWGEGLTVLQCVGSCHCGR